MAQTKKVSKANKKEEIKFDGPLHISVYISHEKGFPTLYLRKKIKEKELLKLIASAALNEQPILIYPFFKTKIQGISSLLKNGVIYFNKEEDNYSFTF